MRAAAQLEKGGGDGPRSQLALEPPSGARGTSVSRREPGPKEAVWTHWCGCCPEERWWVGRPILEAGSELLQ